MQNNLKALRNITSNCTELANLYFRIFILPYNLFTRNKKGENMCISFTGMVKVNNTTYVNANDITHVYKRPDKVVVEWKDIGSLQTGLSSASFKGAKFADIAKKVAEAQSANSPCINLTA